MIIIQTPLRISFFGGGTDFPTYFMEEGGCVLTTAINKYIFVMIKERFDNLVRVAYTRTEIVENVDEINHELIREALQKTGVRKGVEIITMGDIPAGSGLGSSSTVTVGALHAMYAYQGKAVSAERLAREACEIEVDILKKPIGFQDQYIAAYGGLRFIEFTQDGQVKIENLLIRPDIQRRLNEHILLFFTGTTRKAESILGEQRDNIHNRLDVLRELKHNAYIARDALCNGDVEALGSLFHRSWQLKKQLANGISNDILEEAYSAAVKAGALGGKITGAGGGGFLFLFVPLSKRDSVRDALNRLQELPIQLEKDGSKVIFHYQY